MSAGAHHHPQVGRLSGKLEIELNDRVVKFGVFQEHPLVFLPIDLGSDERTVTKRELALEVPTCAHGPRVKVFAEQNRTPLAHQQFRILVARSVDGKRG